MIDKRGLKRTCPKCGAIFYDMGKKDFACPKCGKKFSTESYQQEKTKTLNKKIKHDSAHLEEEIDTETLLKMTNTMDDIEKDPNELLDIEESETDDMGALGEYMDDNYNDEKDM